MSEPKVNPETGEVLDAGCAPCGRPWGTRLWPGGPILGGKEWQKFATEKAKRKAETAPLPKLKRESGKWE